MPRVSETFPSRNLTAGELQGKDLIVTIDYVELVSFDDGDKYRISCLELHKPFICNRTNAHVIAALYGDETDDWIGRQIRLFTCMVRTKDGPKLSIQVDGKLPPVRKPERPANRPVGKPARVVAQDEADMDADRWEAEGRR